MTGNATADRPQPAGREAELEAELATAEALNAALEASRAELRESRERLEAVVAHTAIGVGQTDLEGRFVLVNDRQCEILGRSREELLGGVRMLDVTHPRTGPPTRRCCGACSRPASPSRSRSATSGRTARRFG